MSWIDLKDKQEPSEELPISVAIEKKWCSIFPGKADISGLKKKLTQSSEINYFSPEVQQKNNATQIARAFHDELGVKTIPFVFCDDLLSGDVLRLPFWKSWQAELAPIFQAAGVKTSSIIRCLIALMPPGCVIPVHHDTGIWSLFSHRIHVPIKTAPNQTDSMDQQGSVQFLCGSRNESIYRVPFGEGEIIELNNRAKHCVKNTWTEGRMHLIFDFVEDDIACRLNFIDLENGVELSQTRRSITVDGGVKKEQEEEEEEEEVECLADADERAKRSEIIIQLAKGNSMIVIDSIKKQESQEEKLSDMASIRVQVFLHACKRFGAGELREEALIRRMVTVFGRDDMKMVFEDLELARLVLDNERRNSLVKAYKKYCNDIAREDIQFGIPTSLSTTCGAAAAAAVTKGVGPVVFFLIGAMKCGTTSLYDYISQHPNSIKSKQKEPHFLDWKWQAVCMTELNHNQVAYACQFYAPSSSSSVFGKERNFLRDKFCQLFNNNNNNNNRWIMGEASPSYLLGGSVVARRAKAVAPDAKILVILRDPVKRAFSQYEMIADNTNCTPEQRKRRGNLENKSFSDVIDEDLIRLSNGRISASTIAPHFEARYLSTCPSGHGNHSYVGRGLYALQLETWLENFASHQFCILFLDEFSITSNDEGDHESRVNQAMEPVWKHLHVDSAIVNDTSKKNSRGTYKNTMSLEMHVKLKNYYRPHNERLIRVLQSISKGHGHVSSNFDRIIESWNI